MAIGNIDNGGMFTQETHKLGELPLPTEREWYNLFLGVGASLKRIADAVELEDDLATLTDQLGQVSTETLLDLDSMLEKSGLFGPSDEKKS